MIFSRKKNEDEWKKTAKDLIVTETEQISVETKSTNTSISEKCVLDTLSSINQLLTFMTSLDYVKEMINDANTQAQMVEMVASSSEELASSTEDISNYVQDSANQMKLAIAETEKKSNSCRSNL